MKKTFYFSHDYHARNDGKMVKLMMREGVAGIGVYWCIVEMLYEANGRLMRMECERIAFELRTDIERITNVVFNFDLFEYDDDYFWSNSILDRLEQRSEKSKSASNSAKFRWNNANALRPECDSNAIKERKGKERKLNILSNDSIIIPKVEIPNHPLCEYIHRSFPTILKLKEQLTPDQADKLIDEFGKAAVAETLEQMENWIPLQKKSKSVYLTCKNWLKRRPQTTNSNGKQPKPTFTQAATDWLNRTSENSVFGN